MDKNIHKLTNYIDNTNKSINGGINGANELKSNMNSIENVTLFY